MLVGWHDRADKGIASAGPPHPRRLVVSMCRFRWLAVAFREGRSLVNLALYCWGSSADNPILIQSVMAKSVKLNRSGLPFVSTISTP
jgi:hypothetical protein